jgi:succinyl-CoA synthetase beta subunit
MSRQKLTEYKAKSLLLGEKYSGISCNSDNFKAVLSTIPNHKSYVVKVDQGEKKRFKRGLIGINLPANLLVEKIEEFIKKGFSQFLIEEYIAHEPENEVYISFERVRDGILCLYNPFGGVHTEDHTEKLAQFLLRTEEDIENLQRETGVDLFILQNIWNRFKNDFFGFLEINPITKVDNEWILMDCALTVDDTGEYFVKDSWTSLDFVQNVQSTPEEIAVRALDSQTPASLKLQVLNPHGALGLLLSSGGASIVIADEIHSLGFGKEIINYGEYSGGPTREETCEYAKQVLSLLIKSNCERKALIIAGNVANFTDILQTFKGIIDALDEYKSVLQNQHIKVFVRRGGPNEVEGLRVMKEFLVKNNLYGSVHGSEATITAAVHDAVDSIKI